MRCLLKRALQLVLLLEERRHLQDKWDGLSVNRLPGKTTLMLGMPTFWILLGLGMVPSSFGQQMQNSMNSAALQSDFSPGPVI